jgi:hypothetical protein
VSPKHRCAGVYRTFPEGATQPVQEQLVGVDGKWAFSGLDAWAHYYIVIVDDFRLQDGGGSSIPAVVGPLAVPATPGDAGTLLTVQVKPVRLTLLESKTAGTSMQVQWASAYVFDPSSGAKLEGSAQVAVVIGGVATPMPWGPDPMKNTSYFVQFAMPPPAQPSYTITTSAPAFGSNPVSWTLVAEPPSFDGAIGSPADGATVPANKPLAVTWTTEPSADFVLTELFAQGAAGGWARAYTSPAPNESTVATETIPGAALPAGQYLLNVVFTKANCPAAADGCVLASSIAVARFTAQ